MAGLLEVHYPHLFLFINGWSAIAHHRPDCQDDTRARKRCSNPPPFFPIAMKGLDNQIPLDKSNPLLLYHRYLSGSYHNSPFRQPLKHIGDPKLTALFMLGRSLCSMGAERFNDKECIEWRSREDRVKTNKGPSLIRNYAVTVIPERIENGVR